MSLPYWQICPARAVCTRAIRSGSFASVQELVDDINAYLAERNANPRPYKWTAKGEAILEKIHRARAALVTADAA